MSTICLVLTIDGEFYVFPVSDELERRHSLHCAGRWAANPDLIFGWYHAAVVSAEIHAVGSRETATHEADGDESRRRRIF